MEKPSKAAQERARAQEKLARGEWKELETYTAKQIAVRLGTDGKTLRKFFRSKHSTVEPVGQGRRYEFDKDDLPKIKREFDAWAGPTRKPMPLKLVPALPTEDISMERVAQAIERSQEPDEEYLDAALAAVLGADPSSDDPFDEADYEPTEEELDKEAAELADLDDIRDEEHENDD